MPNRALTTHSLPAWDAAVVGTLRSGDVILPSGVADASFRPSRNTSTTWLAFRTTYSALPCSSRPSPFATLTPPVEIGVASPVVGSTPNLPPSQQSTPIHPHRSA